MKRVILILLTTLSMGLAATVADDTAGTRSAAFEYTGYEVNIAAEQDLELALAPFRSAGMLNRMTPELERLQHLFRRLTAAAMRRSDLARKLDWEVYVHEGRFAEAYSRAGGKVVISARFVERYRPNDAQLALVLAHEIAHVLCEHERMNLSAVWRMNAPQRLQARYAMEFLDTEPMLRARLAPISRIQERVADRVGLELAISAGFDPLSALGFFDSSADDGQGGDIFPGVHDSPAARKSSLEPATALFRQVLSTLPGRELNCAP